MRRLIGPAADEAQRFAAQTIGEEPRRRQGVIGLGSDQCARRQNGRERWLLASGGALQQAARPRENHRGGDPLEPCASFAHQRLASRPVEPERRSVLAGGAGRKAEAF